MRTDRDQMVEAELLLRVVQPLSGRCGALVPILRAHVQSMAPSRSSEMNNGPEFTVVTETTVSTRGETGIMSSGSPRVSVVRASDP